MVQPQRPASARGLGSNPSGVNAIRRHNAFRQPLVGAHIFVSHSSAMRFVSHSSARIFVICQLLVSNIYFVSHSSAYLSALYYIFFLSGEEAVSVVLG